ncbi:LutB/LldF family L-lactate oxidation iron-sulfur protein [Pseudomaricurvus sp. HS19]|uniref:LutB/LldF family L-lactate oxidation iron-sulfur protein n=1 Tax=Pseudomaricurvus sp. HS19 TaxID=2692626 RepID=UPI00136BBB08|nr:LutB/LldF family L-lactate oxidation iron-sulfur protein [Pseudomaricurvus sp. HS19]MYM63350.1 iron-sulfur cluster-binding protein [Pseudomaricurvus sp. HS19]
MSHNFIVRSQEALTNEQLQSALAKAGGGFVARRQSAIDQVPDFEQMRDQAQAVRQKSLANLDIYLAYFEQQVEAAGGKVHWARSPEDLRRIVIGICQQAGARTIAKGKSMVGEEAHLNAALEAAGMIPWETDLGEYILQLAQEPPSHIVAPALHKTKAEIEALFRNAHQLGERDLQEVKAIVDEARDVIRERFLTADVGITGANMLIAETGTAVLVTNEGNGDLSSCLPKTHIITTTFDRVVPTWEDASKIIRVLARSATGQPITSYTSFFSGPKGENDHDGPEAFHVVLLDNHRSEILASDYREMLHCIRCGACMNHCPVYQAVGGHAYDSVYPGPMGAVLSPLLRGYPQDYELPNASSFCGRCESVCPVRIPLPGLMRKLREQERQVAPPPRVNRTLLSSFAWLASKPALYRRLTSAGSWLLHKLGRGKGRLHKVPLARGWSQQRELPLPQGASFQSQWEQHLKDKAKKSSPQGGGRG